MSFPSLPAPLHSFLSLFPLKTLPPVPFSKVFIAPTIWIHPSKEQDSPLSADVECLKWQAYLALRGINALRIRTDISHQGAIHSRLPNLHISPDELLPAHHIPSWADSKLAESPAQFEGYKDEAARDESRAWVSLLEGHVHAALEFSTPRPSYLSLLSLNSQPSTRLQSIITPPPAPLTGFMSLFPPSGTRVSYAAIIAQYRDAITALSDRLSTDKWFLGSENPTPLDALVFAYLHSIVNSQDSSLRFEVNRRVNLIAWEWRVRAVVRAAFISS